MPTTVPKRSTRGFTLIELLVVVAIIALLISILLPSLARAREQAKIVKCLANTRSLSLGVLTFSEDHEGYGQLMTRGDAWQKIDSGMRRFAYDIPDSDSEKATLSPWPVAYARYIGAASMTTANYFSTSPGGGGGGGGRSRGGGGAGPATVRKTKAGVLRCPSDPVPVSNVGYPRTLFGVLSYSINLDLFGTAADGRRTWREGKARAGNPLQGKLDPIVRPSEVVVFVDGGNDPYESDVPLTINSDEDYGPDLPAYFIHEHGLPLRRHSKKGGLVAGLADGHGKYLRAVTWDDHNVAGGNVQKAVTRFSPNPRVTPYEAFDRSAPADGGGRGGRGR